MAIVSAPQAKVLEAVRESLGRVPWVEAVLVAPGPAALQVWTIPSPPDGAGEEAIYPREVELIRTFPGEHFDFHFAERAQVEDLRRAGAVIAFAW